MPCKSKGAWSCEILTKGMKKYYEILSNNENEDEDED